MAGSATASECSVDRAAMLALDEHAFDQEMDGGWRRVAERPGCASAAADLIAAYREAHPDHTTILYWHEGQLRASEGQAEAAIALFERSYERGNIWNIDSGWNSYVDATIAFMRRDMGGLKAAREKLAALPPPAEQHGARPEAKTIKTRSWPPNLSVVDGLIHCFDEPYQLAYGEACRSRKSK